MDDIPAQRRRPARPRQRKQVVTPVSADGPAAPVRGRSAGRSGGSGDGNGPPLRTVADRPPPGGPPLPTAVNDGGDRSKPRVRKLRLLAVLVGFGALALVSTVFGMLMAVASDIPQLENFAQYKHLQSNSYLYDDQGHLIGILDPPTHTVIDQWKQMSPNVVHAVIAVEDRRFWSEPGIDLRGILRAVLSDFTGGSHQGASTITEQFVKNALQEENNRTIFEKLREAALAFHLTHRWHKTRILTEYLNTVYFGNGAYGVESAARVYFGNQLGYDPNAPTDGTTTGCGNGPPQKATACASQVTPAQAALLAGMIASPGAFDPVTNHGAAVARRNLALKDMLDQHYISQSQYQQGVNTPVPTQADIQQPAEPSAAPYFTSWLRPQIRRALINEGVPKNIADYRAVYGGLRIKTTLDLSLQQAADQAVQQVLPYGPGQPTASMVAIDNHTGEVRAMVGGPIINGKEDFQHYPFNLATEGHRQPGSAFKPFTLAVALEDGIGPDSVWTSAPQDFIVPNSGGKEHFIVHNFGNQYSGSISLQGATDVSDNSVFSQVGIRVGPQNVANTAEAMGIRTPVSSNYAMILGAMKEGPTLLDMAHAYETFATGGLRVFNNTLGDLSEGPIGIHEIDCSHCPGIPSRVVNKPQFDRILPAPIAQEVGQMLTGPVASGTATQAAISGVIVSGKTGTTSNYADAWFVGWTPQMTTAVWVGFPNKLVPMATLYNGGPVEGGTFPAIIWHAFMVQALQILAQEAAGQQTNTTTTPLTTVTPATAGGPTSTATTATTTPAATTPAHAKQAPPTGPQTPNPAATNTPAKTGGTQGGTTGGTQGGTTGGTPGNTGGTGIPTGKH